MEVMSEYGTTPISLAVALVTVLVAVIYYTLSTKDLPPGPIGLPLVGYWPFLKNETCNLQMDALKKKYGDISSFSSTGRLYINLASVKAVREAHINKSDCFGGRIQEFGLLYHTFKDGVAITNGEAWKVLRKFFLQSLKDYGVLSIKDVSSGSMYESINSTIQELKAQIGKPVNIVQMVTNKCNTILRQTLFGDSTVSEYQIREINELYGPVLAMQTATNFLATGKVAQYLLFPFMSGFRESMQSQEKIEKILYSIIDQHKSTYDVEHIRDIIDEYIKERDERTKRGDASAVHFTDKALMYTLVQIFGDGVLSVASFVCLFIKFVLDHPEEEQKIYKEIMEVVGPDRQPTVEDKSKLSYTNAFLLEALRTSDFIPFFPSLECTKETTLRGYRIPKGSVTLMNVWSAHFDPDTYEEPHKFNPSRYLVTEGKRRAELPITFGVGKRACIGEGFTMIQVFLFLTTIIQNFHLSLPQTSKSTTFDQLMSGELLINVQPRSTL